MKESRLIRSSRLAARNAALALVLLAPGMASGQDASPAAPQEQAPATAPKQDKPKSANENAQAVNPTRFGKPPEDDAFGAYQRGLYKTAYNLALPRAEAGDAAAQVLVAEILSRGLGVPFNPAEAAKWYGKAAEQGSPEAQFRYSAILLDGQYVAKDPAKARQLTEAAANAGNAAAQFNLGQMRPPSRRPTGCDKPRPAAVFRAFSCLSRDFVVLERHYRSPRAPVQTSIRIDK